MPFKKWSVLSSKIETPIQIEDIVRTTLASEKDKQRLQKRNNFLSHLFPNNVSTT